MSVMKVKFAEANLNQLKSATKQFCEKKKVSSNFIERIYANDKFDKYPSYDDLGNITLVGNAKRLTDLKNNNLDKNATIEEFFTKQWENLQNTIITISEKIKNI